MKRSLLFFVLCCSLLVAPALIQAQALPPGMTVTCDDGTSFTNGVEVIAHQMRVGYDYTATAIGLNGFDPVLAVLDARTGQGLCNDDSTGAVAYDATLPSSGYVPADSASAQKIFHPNGSSGFEDISLVVGGYGDQSGEFLLFLEGMGVTPGDGTGDSFSVNITPGMTNSGIPLSVYMIAKNTDLDPFMFRSDAKLNPLKDDSGDYIACDDAGDAKTCWGTSDDLSNSGVTLDGTALPGGSYDSMISIPLDNMQLNDDASNNYLNYVMTSSPQNTTTGQYLLVFDIGTSDTTALSTAGSTDGSSGTSGTATGGSEGSNGDSSGDNTGGLGGSTSGGSDGSNSGGLGGLGGLLGSLTPTPASST